MPHFLLIVGRLKEEDSGDLSLASALVDIATESADGPWTQSSNRIDVIAPLDACVELALPLLGRADARTVEGGERRASPLRLHPYGSPDEAESTFAVLRDLFLAGTFESDTFAEQDPELPRSLDEALHGLTDRRDGRSSFVVLGEIEGSDVLPSLSGSRIADLSDAEVDRRIPDHGRGLLEQQEEMIYAARSGAKGAVRLAHFVDSLELGDSLERG